MFFKQLPLFVTMGSLIVGYLLTLNSIIRKRILMLFFDENYIFFRYIYMYLSKK